MRIVLPIIFLILGIICVVAISATQNMPVKSKESWPVCSANPEYLAPIVSYDEKSFLMSISFQAPKGAYEYLSENFERNTYTKVIYPKTQVLEFIMAKDQTDRLIIFDEEKHCKVTYLIKPIPGTNYASISDN